MENPTKAQALLSCLNAGHEAPNRLLESPILTKAERERAQSAHVELAQELVDSGVGILPASKLPARYQEAPNAPPALYCKGDPTCLEAPILGIVGTRAATTYGKAVAQKFAEAIAKAGVTIVSGGALGIDAAAHRGALAVGGKTAAVLLTSIERVYPRVHYGLFDQIGQSGCLLSQFAAGTVSNKEYRPIMRNYTVAALSSAVLVVEAPERSGALSTASAANELGRQVFVAPANIDNINFRGSHGLIRDGATLVDHPDQILEAMGISVESREHTATAFSPQQRKIIEALSTTPLACEFIVERTGLETWEVLSELTMLELDGHVIKDAAGYARRP